MPTSLNPYAISLRDVQFADLQIHNPQGIFLDASMSYRTQANLSFHKLEAEPKLLRTQLSVAANLLDENNHSLTAYANFRFLFFFEIENLNEHWSDEPSPYLGNALASISYSTARGLILAKVQQTVFRGLVLPVIDPNELLVS